MKTKKKKKGLNTMDLILIVVFASLLIFTVYMIYVFTRYGSVPDTLITCVFATLGGECGVMGWIKTSKIRNEDRQWKEEDNKKESEPEHEPFEKNDLPDTM